LASGLHLSTQPQEFDKLPLKSPARIVSWPRLGGLFALFGFRNETHFSVDRLSSYATVRQLPRSLIFNRKRNRVTVNPFCGPWDNLAGLPDHLHAAHRSGSGCEQTAA
jgi:hypothetical protein